MSRFSYKEIILIATGVLSLIAQGLLITPTLLGFLLPSFSQTAKSLVPGLLLFGLSMLLYSGIIGTQYASHRLQWRTNMMLWLTQALTVAGIYLLVDGLAPREQEAGLLLSSFVTILTTYGMVSHTVSLRETPGLPVEENQFPLTDIRMDSGTNMHALQEQIESLTRQLAAEKHRTTQLTLLNELSQQLEAELDPPVAAQLAVNTLERAMECSFVALMAPDGERQEYIVLASAGRMTSIIPPGYRQDANRGLIGRTHRLKKTQMVHDVETDKDFFALENENSIALLAPSISDCFCPS